MRRAGVRYPEVATIAGKACVNVPTVFWLLYESSRGAATPPDERTRALVRRFGERAEAALAAERLLSGLDELDQHRTQEILNRTFRLDEAERQLVRGATFNDWLAWLVGEASS